MSSIRLPMYSYRVQLALLPLLLFSFMISAQEGSIIKNVSIDSLDLALTDIINDHTQDFADTTQLAIALLKGDQLHFIGVEKIDGSITPIDNKDRVFEIGSISKVFTATMLGQMVGTETLNLEDRAGQILGLSDLDDYGVTLQHLANHTSGLISLPTNLDLIGDPANPYKAYHSDLLMAYLSEDIDLLTLPGESYAYSNLGAGLLGHILTVKSGQSYEELLQESICRPIGLNSTTSQRVAVAEDLLVTGRQPNGDIASNWDFDALVGAGGILSTVEDLIQFARSQIELDHTTLTHNSTYQLNENMAVGLGWHIIKPQSGGDWLWHNGGTGGYTSSMTIDKVNKTSVVILTNVSAFHTSMGRIDQLGFALLKELNNK